MKPIRAHHDVGDRTTWEIADAKIGDARAIADLVRAAAVGEQVYAPVDAGAGTIADVEADRRTEASSPVHPAKANPGRLDALRRGFAARGLALRSEGCDYHLIVAIVSPPAPPDCEGWRYDGAVVRSFAATLATGDFLRPNLPRTFIEGVRRELRARDLDLRDCRDQLFMVIRR